MVVWAAVGWIFGRPLEIFRKGEIFEDSGVLMEEEAREAGSAFRRRDFCLREEDRAESFRERRGARSFREGGF